MSRPSSPPRSEPASDPPCRFPKRECKATRGSLGNRPAPVFSVGECLLQRCLANTMPGHPRTGFLPDLSVNHQKDHSEWGHQGRRSAAILRRVLAAIVKAWPKVQVTLRGDSHFSTPEVHEVCEEYGLSLIRGKAPNSKLHELGVPRIEQARAQAGKVRQSGVGAALYQFLLPSQELEAPAAHPLQGREVTPISRTVFRLDLYPLINDTSRS